jgi:membrane protease YdiL (CAAX protease family)
MTAILLLLTIPVLMWLSQTVLLLADGKPLRRRIHASDLSPRLKRINRLVTNGALLAVVVVYPLIRGLSPAAYYAQLLPAAQAHLVVPGVCLAVLYLAVLYLAWVITGNVDFEVRHGAGKLTRRLLGVPLTAAFAAGAEELLFRGVLLADLMQWLPVLPAVLVSAVIFAAAHYVRDVKRYWTFPGHVALGVLFCAAFAVTQSLWLPFGLHAGGILILMGVRPFVRYRGPAWTVGASIFPYAGVVGIFALALLTLNVWLQWGGMA